MLTAAIWPALDYSRVPYRLYHDPEAYEREQERIFRGPAWNFLCLEAEIPNSGDFRATYVGETAVIVNRDADGAIHAFVNRCAHRGARSGASCRATPPSTPAFITNGAIGSTAA